MDDFFGLFQPLAPPSGATAPCNSELDYHHQPSYYNLPSQSQPPPAPVSQFPPPYPHPQFPPGADSYSFRRSDTQQQCGRPAYGPYGWGARRDYHHCRPQQTHPVYHLSANRKRAREEYLGEPVGYGAAAYGAAAYGAAANSPVGIYCTPSPPDSGIDHESPSKDLTSSFPMASGQLPPLVPLPPSPQDGVQVALLKRDLWEMFYQADTEMIVTKNGR